MEKDDKGSTMIRMGVSGWMWVVPDQRPLNGRCCCCCCWHNDAHWSHTADSPFKLWTFGKSKMAAAAILENRKIAVFQQLLDWSSQNLAPYCRLTKQMKHDRSCDIQIWWPSFENVALGLCPRATFSTLGALSLGNSGASCLFVELKRFDLTLKWHS